MNGLQANQLLQSVQDASQNCGIEKKCPRCGETKTLDLFGRYPRAKDARYYICKTCKSIADKKWRQSHRDQKREADRLWHEKNKERHIKTCRMWRQKNVEKSREISRRWYANHTEQKKEIGKRCRKKKMATYKGRISQYISNTIYLQIKQNKNNRHWENLVGYTFDDLKKHLEKQFKDGMTWGNYGDWHLDHIVPKSVFNFNKPEDEDFKRCWSLKNLQPLWARDNIIKNNKLDKHFQPRLVF